MRSAVTSGGCNRHPQQPASAPQGRQQHGVKTPLRGRRHRPPGERRAAGCAPLRPHPTQTCWPLSAPPAPLAKTHTRPAHTPEIAQRETHRSPRGKVVGNSNTPLRPATAAPATPPHPDATKHVSNRSHPAAAQGRAAHGRAGAKTQPPGPDRHAAERTPAGAAPIFSSAFFTYFRAPRRSYSALSGRAEIGPPTSPGPAPTHPQPQPSKPFVWFAGGSCFFFTKKQAAGRATWLRTGRGMCCFLPCLYIHPP